jgi:hypothetical protein
MVQLPSFSEVYYNEQETKEGETQVKTICDIIALEDFSDGKINLKKGDKISFGISRTRATKYNEQLGKKVAYAMAMRFMFMLLSGEKHVQDNTSFRRPS